jgi:hypothetical protein
LAKLGQGADSAVPGASREIARPGLGGVVNFGRLEYVMLPMYWPAGLPNMGTTTPFTVAGRKVTTPARAQSQGGTVHHAEQTHNCSNWIASRRWWALPLAASLLIAACGGNAAQPGGQSGRPVFVPLVESVGGTPPDVPSSKPACSSPANLALTGPYQTWSAQVPPALRATVSMCANYAGDNPEVMVLYNLTNDVLDISAASGTSPAIVVHAPSSAGLLPSWDDLEIYDQNAVVSTQQANMAQGTSLIPVGGEAVVSLDGSYPPLQVNVSVDQRVSRLSYGAQLLTGYVADNLLDKVSVLSYGSSIANCVNAAYNVWQDLTQHDDTGATLASVLQGYLLCRDLVDKVRENRAESLAAEHGDTLTPDLEKVAETAGASTWESELADYQTVHDITLDIR